jgi:RNA polymerase sigma-70 factor (ECF subfamily)
MEFDDWYRLERSSVLATLWLALGDRDVAEDATDEAFARAYARWAVVGQMQSPAGWTFRVALNVARRGWKRERRARGATLMLAASSARAVVAPDLDEFDRLLQPLPQRQRLAMVLRYGADLAESDIAAMMGISRGAVSANLSQARKALRRQLDERSPK